jgi:predicted nucleotidyltransferase
MNAAPLLERIVSALHECRLETVLIGNAAAALQGAPVTTLDFDFMFRKTRSNVEKLKELSRVLDATIFRPYYPSSDLYRLVSEEGGIQLDFMSKIHGVKSFESLRSRASRIQFGSCSLMVAHLEDIIRSKRALGRARDRAVLEILEKTQDEKNKAGR